MGTQVMTWQEKLAADAAADAQKTSDLGAGGKFISFKGGLVSIEGKAVPNNIIKGVILEWCYTRTYYPEFGSGDTTPLCYGLSLDHEVTEPHPEAREKQETSCEGCPMDAWGSAPNGKGKACRIGRRFSIIPASALDDLSKIHEAEVYYANVPVMSIKNFDAHRTLVREVYASFMPDGTKIGMPVYGALSSVTAKPDAKTMFQVLFKADAKLTDEQVAAVMSLRESRGPNSIMFTFAAKEDGKEQPKEAPGTAAARAAKLAGKAKK